MHPDNQKELNNLIDLENEKWKRLKKFEVLCLCLSCKHKWHGLVAANTNLFYLQCPRCSQADSFASFIPQDYYEG